MISFFTSWAQGIIVAVIVATIIEMILPEGTIKKYVKVIIGLYLMFTIIYPIVNKFHKNDFNINELFNTSDYEMKIENSSNKITGKLENNDSKTIKDIYKENVKNDITSKLKQIGYKAYDIFINVLDDDNYTINKIELSAEKSTDNKNSIYTNNIEINKVIISSNKQNEIISNKKLEETDKNKIIDYLSNEYGIKKDIILIN